MRGDGETQAIGTGILHAIRETAPDALAAAAASVYFTSFIASMGAALGRLVY